MGAAQLPVRRTRRSESFPPNNNGTATGRPAALLVAQPGSLRARQAAPAGYGWLLRLLFVLVLLEGLLAWQPGLRLWVWSATVVLVICGALLCIAAGQRQRQFKFVWYAAGCGCLSLLLGFVTRGFTDYDVGRVPVALGRDDSGFQGGALFFLVAALALIRGDGVWLRRAKLALDVAILVIAPLVAAMPIADHWGLGLEQDRVWSTALLYATSYSAVCFALVVATRRNVLNGSSAESLLAIAALALALAAISHGVRLAVPIAARVQFGQSFWTLGVALLVFAGWRATRATALQREPGEPLQRGIGEDSRLRLLPAALAGLVVALVAVEQAGTREPPSAALFFGSSSLFWLIVSRLLATLAENRRLSRVMHTAERSQIALRDLGIALNSSLETERVWQHVCRTGQSVLRADSTVLWLVDRAGRDLVAVEVAGGRRREILNRHISLDDRDSLAVRVTRSRSPELIRQALDARRSHPLLTVLRGAQCILAVPLRGQRAVGALVFTHFRDPVAFREDDVARAEVVANQAAVALRNAELFQEVRRGLDVMSALYEYARACDGAASSEDVARELLETLYGKVDFGQATVLLADSGLLVSARGLMVRRLEGQLEPVFDVAPARLSPLATGAFRTRESVRAVQGEPAFRTLLPESVAQLAVPLVLRDHAIGVVELESSAGDNLNESVEQLVSALARHAALAIDNLRLEEDTREVANLKKLDRLKTELLGTVSHELRTPLAAIKGYATTLLQHQRMKIELRQEFLSVIDTESDRLEELINNLLDMSRLEAGVLKVDPAPVKLGRVVHAAVKHAQHLTDEHELKVEWRSDPWVMADVPRVIQVLTNLLNNAIKYSPDGGEIRISSRLRDALLYIAVVDPGVGIPPREVDKIFDRFHRVEGDLARRVSGTGLGLAICRGLVEAHGGKIWAESQPGVGSTFTFALPTCDPGVS